ncbi:proteoglycan 4-like isoform X2 [Oncorhynchus masou masou]|uniref:proteoglycan 4-like isoform X2 n=1 Tax=Oncorhynchus masou masou TaxID=90313 RepID=UPI0031839EB3
MSQSETCCICGVRFVRGPKGYNRRKVTTLTSPKTFQLVFDITPDDSSFLCWVCLGVLRRKTKQDGKLWTWSDLPTKVGRPRKPRAEIPSSSTTLSNQTVIITNPSLLSIEECIASKKNKRRPVRQWDGEKWTTLTSRSPESHSMAIRRLQTPIAPTTHSSSTPSNQVNSSTLSSQTSNQISSLFSFGERTTKRRPKAPQPTTHSTLLSPFPVDEGIRPKKKKLPFSKTKQSYGFGPHAKALHYMHSHQHLKAFRSLMKTKAREAMTIFLAEVIAQESKVLMKDQRGPLRQPLTEASVSGFSWDAVLAWGEEKAPMTLACLRAMFPKPNTIRTQVMMGAREVKRLRTEEAAGDMVSQRAGLILAIVLYTSMQKCNFIQASLGVEFWKQGCPLSVLKALSALGVCPGAASTRRHAERLTTGFDPPQQDRTEGVVVVEEPGDSFCRSEDESWTLSCSEEYPSSSPTPSLNPFSDLSHSRDGSSSDRSSRPDSRSRSRSDDYQGPTQRPDSREYQNLIKEHGYHKVQKPTLSRWTKNSEDKREANEKPVQNPKRRKMTKKKPAQSPPVVNATGAHRSDMETSQVSKVNMEVVQTSQVDNTQVEPVQTSQVDNTHVEPVQTSQVDNTHVGLVQMSQVDNTHVGLVQMSQVDNTHVELVQMSQVDNTHVEPVHTSQVDNTHVEPVHTSQVDNTHVELVQMSQVDNTHVEPVHMSQVDNTHVEPVHTSQVDNTHVKPVQLSDTNKKPAHISETNVQPAQMSVMGETNMEQIKMPKRGRPRKELAQMSIMSETNMEQIIMPKRGRPRKELAQVSKTPQITDTHLEPAHKLRSPRKKPVQTPQVTDTQNKPIQVSNPDIKLAETNKESVVQAKNGRPKKGFVQIPILTDTCLKPIPVSEVNADTTLMPSSMRSRKRPGQVPQVSGTNQELIQMPRITQTNKEPSEMLQKMDTRIAPAVTSKRGRTRKGPIEMSQETNLHTEAGLMPQAGEMNQQRIEGRETNKEPAEPQKLTGKAKVNQRNKVPAKTPEKLDQMKFIPKRKRGRPRKELAQVINTSKGTPSMHKISKTGKESALTREIKIIVNRMESCSAAEMPQIREMNNEPVQVSTENFEPVQRLSGGSMEGLVQMPQLSCTDMEPGKLGRTIMATTSTAERTDKEPVRRPQANETKAELAQTSQIMETIKEHRQVTNTTKETASVPKRSCTDMELAKRYKMSDFQTRVIRIVDTRMRANKSVSMLQVHDPNQDPEPAATPEIGDTNKQPTRVIRIVVNRRIPADICSHTRKSLECLAEVAAKCAPLDVKSVEEDG